MRLCLVLIAILTLACQKSEQVKTDPSFKDDVQPILSASCATSGCHSGAAPSGSYDLSSRAGAMGNGSDTIPNVIPGNADSSKLYQRIDYGEMPPSAPLDNMKSATIRNWVNKGAKDN
jgi:hypothetical protein